MDSPPSITSSTSKKKPRCITANQQTLSPLIRLSTDLGSFSISFAQQLSSLLSAKEIATAAQTCSGALDGLPYHVPTNYTIPKHFLHSRRTASTALPNCGRCLTKIMPTEIMPTVGEW